MLLQTKQHIITVTSVSYGNDFHPMENMPVNTFSLQLLSGTLQAFGIAYPRLPPGNG